MMKSHTSHLYKTTLRLCPGCGEVHLEIQHNGRVLATFPMTRDEWAKLIGTYGDLIGAAQYEFG